MKFKKLAKVIPQNENILIKENENIEYRGKLKKLDKTDIKKLGEYTVINVRPMVVSTSQVVYLGIELLQIGEKPVPQTMTPKSFTDPFVIQPEDSRYKIRTKDTSTTIGCTKSLEELYLENRYGYDSGYNEVI